MDVDRKGAEEGEGAQDQDQVEKIFCRGGRDEEFAAEVGGVAAGAWDGRMAGAGVGPRFTDQEALMGDPDGRDQEEEGEGEE